MKGNLWMEIRSEKKKGLSYAEIGRKHHIDPRTAKKYAESEEVPKYTLKQKRPSKLDPYKDYIRYHSLDDLNGQALAWCRKVNNRVHGTTNKIPAQQLAEECLQPMLREYITDKMNVRKVEKDCLISYAGNKYSVPAEYIGKDVTVLVLKNMLSVYHNGEQIALHRLSYNKNEITVNKEHYRPRMTRQIFHVKNTMIHGPEIIDYSIVPDDLSQYDSLIGGGFDE